MLFLVDLPVELRLIDLLITGTRNQPEIGVQVADTLGIFRCACSISGQPETCSQCAGLRIKCIGSGGRARKIARGQVAGRGGRQRRIWQRVKRGRIGRYSSQREDSAVLIVGVQEEQLVLDDRTAGRKSVDLANVLRLERSRYV